MSVAATEAAEVTETTEEVATEEEADVSMTDEEATATRARLLQGLATTDTEALLHRAELTATSQAARTETIHPDAAAARPPTTALEAVHPLLPDAAAIPPVHVLPHRRLASHAGAATTDQCREMSPTAKKTPDTKATAVAKAVDPVRVLLLTSVAHDRPDVTANPTTPAAVDRLRTIADPLLPRNATAELRHQSLARRLVGVAMHQCQDPDHVRAHAHAHHRGVATSVMTRSSYCAPTDVTSEGSAQITKQAAVAVAAAAAAVTGHHHQRPAKRRILKNEREVTMVNYTSPPPNFSAATVTETDCEFAMGDYTGRFEEPDEFLFVILPGTSRAVSIPTSAKPSMKTYNFEHSLMNQLISQCRKTLLPSHVRENIV